MTDYRKTPHSGVQIMPHKKTTTTRREIQSFAVQYQAYCEATREGNRRDQLLWGKLLHESQESLGIQLAKLDSEYFAILQRAAR